MRRISAAIAVCSVLSSAGCFLALGFGDYDKSDPELTKTDGGGSEGGDEGGGSAFFTTSPPEVVLMPGGSATVEARVQRKDGFMGVVRLSATGLPPGVTTNANGLVIASTGSSATITINAAPDAKHTKATIELRAETDGKVFDAKIGLLLRGPPGSIDTGFGTNGVTNVAFAEASNLNHLILMPDDRILLGGDEGGSAFAIARLDANGQPDKTLGGTGALTTKNGASAGATGLALLPSGFVAVGAGAGKVVVIRYRDDGTFDPTFNGGNPALVDIATFGVSSVFPKTGGGFALTGTDGFNASVLHIGANGAIESSVGDAGVVTSSTGGAIEAATLENGTIVGGGASGKGACALFDFPAFGTGTPTAPEPVTGCRNVNDVFAGDGGVRAVAGSSLSIQSKTTFIAYRRTPTDKERPVVNLGEGTAFGIVVDSASRVVVVGNRSGFDDRRFFIARILPDDAIDPTFILSPLPIGTAMSARRVAIQKDGRIVVAGTSESLGKGTLAFTVARYWP